MTPERVAVIGGTGLAGRHTVAALRAAGHEPVVVARSTGVDVRTGTGLDDAVRGCTAVIDLLNTPALHAEQCQAFFTATTIQLLAAGHRAGVRHHVVLSVVGVDRADGNPHYAGKRRQEELALHGGLPATVLRSTQFFEFAELLVGLGLRGEEALVPPLLVQPVAVADVAARLAAIATGTPLNGVTELAGPAPEDLVDMARRTLQMRGESLRLVPSWRGAFGPKLAGEVLLPGPQAELATTTFEQWLGEQARA